MHSCGASVLFFVMLISAEVNKTHQRLFRCHFNRILNVIIHSATCTFLSPCILCLFYFVCPLLQCSCFCRVLVRFLPAVCRIIWVACLVGSRDTSGLGYWRVHGSTPSHPPAKPNGLVYLFNNEMMDQHVNFNRHAAIRVQDIFLPNSSSMFAQGMSFSAMERSCVARKGRCNWENVACVEIGLCLLREANFSLSWFLFCLKSLTVLQWSSPGYAEDYCICSWIHVGTIRCSRSMPAQLPLPFASSISLFCSHSLLLRYATIAAIVSSTPSSSVDCQLWCRLLDFNTVPKSWFLDTRSGAKRILVKCTGTSGFQEWTRHLSWFFFLVPWQLLEQCTAFFIWVSCVLSMFVSDLQSRTSRFFWE
jgi:hypothetical protein